jgi:acetyl-CoA/propionyl-CoA carboxylase biotin carboxyl carrier protein
VTKRFLPSPGRITAYREPGGIGVRVDSGVRAGDAVSDLYDPLVAKLIVHDTTRELARRRMLRALHEFVVSGPATLLGFHRALLESQCFVDGETCHGIVESDELAQRAQELDAEQAGHPERDGARAGSGTRERVVAVELDGRRHELRLHDPEPPWAELARRHRQRQRGLGGGASGAVVSPMQGVVLEVKVADGDSVVAGALICVVEAMKMENEITAHRDGVVTGLAVAPGEQLAHGQVICVVEGE